MSGKRYPEEFKTEAVKQVVDRGYSVASVATRLDITTHSLYAWIKKYGPDSSTHKEQSDAQAEIRRLQKRAETGYRRTGHIKKSPGVLRKAVRLRYAFIRDNSCCWACSPALSGAGCSIPVFLRLASAPHHNAIRQT